jgi:N-carbamoyl-L-amino-acid hydrolase
VLEEAGVDLGIVTSVVGITRVEIEVSGMADHAGTTPMHLRHDALVAAAGMVAEVRRLALRRIEAGGGYFVATTGELTVTPNAANVVPGKVRLLVEARGEAPDSIKVFLGELAQGTRRIAEASGVTLSSYRLLSEAPPTPFDPGLVSTLEAAASRNGVSFVRLPSGAGHDAVFFSRIAPTAMIFVPSRAGRSHCPEEWTDKQELALGALVQFDAILELDRSG